MMPYDPSRTYQKNLDVRDFSAWVDRLMHEEPNGAFWPLVGLRRSGKSWALKAIEGLLPSGFGKGVDLRSDADVKQFEAKREGGCLLIDEPGPLLLKQMARFLELCASHKANRTRLLVAMTPREWEMSLQAGISQGIVQGKDLNGMPPLSNEQALKQARSELAKTLLSQLPAYWKRNPFILELVFDTAEKNRALAGDVPRLLKKVLDLAEDKVAYIDQVFTKGLSESQKESLRQLAYKTGVVPGESIRLLEEWGLVSEVSEKMFEIADPVIASHLPPPLVVHHISDIHFGKNSAVLVDKKERGGHSDRMSTAAGEHFVRDTYIAHVKGRRGAARPVNIVVVSGDVGETAGDVEYAEATKWLAELEASLGDHPDIPNSPARVSMVGGNHDVNWDAAGPELSSRARHNQFAKAMQRYCHPHLEVDAKERALATVRYPDFGMEIILLGSAELGGEHVDDVVQKELRAILRTFLDKARSALDTGDVAGYENSMQVVNRIDPGLVHYKDLEKLASLGAELLPLKIAVLHHPVSPMPSSVEIARFSGLLNAGAVKNALFKARVSLVLHGHQHSGWFSEERWPQEFGEHTLRVAAAPTLGSHETQEAQGFNEIQICREGTTRFSVVVQRFIRRGADWAPDGRPLIFHQTHVA